MTAPVVIKLGGAAIDRAAEHPALWDALATLAATTPLAIVHGGGAAVDTHLAALGLKSERVAGLRVTPDDQIEHVVAILRGVVNTRLVGLLAARDCQAVGLGLSDGNACRCTKLAPDGHDLGRVGQIDPNTARDNTAGAIWNALLSQGLTPVISSIGLDDTGAPLNVNADDAALGVAKILRAHALVLLTDVPGILDASGSLVDETNAQHIEQLIETGAITGGMIPKARAAAAGADHAGVPTIIASWAQPQRLAGLASSEQVGTRVMPTRSRPVGAAT